MTGAEKARRAVWEMRSERKGGNLKNTVSVYYCEELGFILSKRGNDMNRLTF